jgi:teichuronic acid biosynthesis glycosyltransferase TuaG
MTQETNPSVSIIIGSFNAEKYIRETLDSVANQTFKSFEAIIVDDCSTDNTVRIIQEYCDQDTRFKLIKLESNSNLPAVPRNVGLKHACGEFIAFLDHDDIWTHKKIQRQISALQVNPHLDLVFSYLWSFKKKSLLRGLILMPNPFKNKINYERLRTGNALMYSSVFARKKIIISLNGFDENPKLRAIEDYDLWLRVSQQYQIGYISEVHGYYRVTDSSASRSDMSLEKYKYMDTFRNTRNLTKNKGLIIRITKKIIDIPVGFFFHVCEGWIRQYFFNRSRVFNPHEE